MENCIVAAVLLPVLLIPGLSCKKVTGAPESDGVLVFRFDGNPRELSKVSEELPDTNEFLITVSGESGDVVFDGVYCDLPEKLEVPSGSYGIFVRSEDFEGLRFSSPQYGDEQCVVVPPGGVMTVSLGCRQINSGIRLSVSLVLYDSGEETVLLTRTLVSQEILTLKVSVSAALSPERRGITIDLDTSRVWTNETFMLGEGDSKGASYENALTVSQALASIGREDVWVSGFIVGGDLTSANASFAPPFKSASNLLLGPRSASSSRENCIAVQLSAGEVRDALNLAEHPDMLGRLVCLNGDIEGAYYGMTGLKSVSDFVLK